MNFSTKNKVLFKQGAFVIFLMFFMGFAHNAIGQCLSCPVTGLTTVTEGTTNKYTTSRVPGAGYFWSVIGPGLQIEGSNKSNIVKVLATKAGSGSVCLTRYKSGNKPCSVCKTITIKKPEGCKLSSVNIIRTGGISCPTNFRAVTNPTVLNTKDIIYSWSISPRGKILSGQGTPNVVVTYPAGIGGGEIAVKVRACDTTVAATNRILCEPICGGRPCIVASPNPSKDGFMLNLDDSNFQSVAAGAKSIQGESAREAIAVRLIDLQGKVVRSYSTKESSFYIDTYGVVSGRYYIEVIQADGNKIVRSIVTK